METERLKQISEMMETRITRIKMALYILVEEGIMTPLEAYVITKSIIEEEVFKHGKNVQETKTHKKHN